MRVLMTADTVGGVWTYTMELARALAPHQVEIALATMGAPLSGDQRAEVSALANVHVHESTYRLEWMDEPWADVDRAGEWLLGLAHAERPAVVHLNGYAHAALPWGAPVLVVGHSCVRSWFAAVQGIAAPGGWSVYGERVSAGLHSADVVVAPTRAMLDALELHYGALRRSRVIANGRAAEPFPPGDTQPLIMSAGLLWDDAKNVAALDRVAPALPWPVYVAGDAAAPGASEGRGFTGVRPLGRVDRAQLARWLGRASLYVLPARYEPFGLSALEAALAGCALVLGDIPSLREVWGDAASFVPPDDDDAIATAVRALCEDDARRSELSRRARACALELTPARMAQAYATLYGTLARRGHGQREETNACAS
jgi:glycogen(starch) synthase